MYSTSTHYYTTTKSDGRYLTTYDTVATTAAGSTYDGGRTYSGVISYSSYASIAHSQEGTPKAGLAIYLVVPAIGTLLLSIIL